MRMKKYIVSSIPEAMPMIRNDLGPEAAIIQTNKIKTGGFMGLFKKEQVEVVAAVDPHSQQVYSSDTKQVSSLTERSHKHLSYEIEHMKKLFMNTMMTEEKQLPLPIQSMNKRLVQQDVSEPIRNRFIEKLIIDWKHEIQYTDHEIYSLFKTELTMDLQSLPLEPRHTFSKCTCFVGPTGVGKTTTIAKLAAHLMFDHNKKVGLITTDTYRIAAVEQLKTYATILNIPIETVFSPDKVTQALQKLDGCEVILLDTTGRNYMEESYISELKSFLPQTEDIETHLVLSLTSKSQDLEALMSTIIQQVHIDRLILTKTDETSSYGAILNLLHRFKIPLTYLTNGQNVPDDLQVATPELIADFVWGEDDFERSS